MHQLSTLAVALFGAALSAQGPAANGGSPSKMPRPAVAVPDPKSPLPRSDSAAPVPALTPEVRRVIDAAARDSSLVIVDRPVAGGAVFCRGDDYKAKFDTDGGWTFVAQPPIGEPAQPIEFGLESCSVGGVSLFLTRRTELDLGDQRVAYQRDGVVEVIDFRPNGVEQSFVFAALPERGELVIRIGTAGDRDLRDDGDGLVFAGSAGDVGYSEAVAIDARGRSVAAPTMVDGDDIVIRVPAAFIEAAALPLIVDPVIANQTVVSGSVPYSDADIAWDAATGTFAVVYERYFSTTDTDVHLRRVDRDMNPVGGLTTIDVTFDVWRLPRIANCRFYGRHLVVVEVSADGPPPSWIGGRVVEGNGNVATGQIDIARNSVSGHAFGSKINPDVGGDPSGAPPTYFTVVFERVYSTTDHDIHMKQVTWDGQLRSASPTLIDNSTANETRPSISNSNGPPPAAQQRHVVCYEREVGSSGPDIHVALLEWDGQLFPAAGGNPFLLNGHASLHRRPVASTPTDGSLDGMRYSMIAFEQLGFQNGDIMGQVITTDGAIVRTSVDLTAIELGNDPRVLHEQRRPRIDSDGVRFALVYEDEDPAGAVDSWVALFGWEPVQTGLAVHDSGRLVESLSMFEPEAGPAVASIYGAAASGSRELDYGIAFERGSGTTAINAKLYGGYGHGVYSYAVVNCGGAVIQHTGGVPAIGAALEFEVPNATLAGFVIGFPQAPAIPVPGCAGCLVGVNGAGILLNPLPLAIPPDVRFVGVDLAVQGFELANGPCLGSIALTDAVNFRVQ